MPARFPGFAFAVRALLFVLAAPMAAWCQDAPATRAAEAFLYVTDTEVRHEILLPLAALESLLPIPRGTPDTVTVAEQAAAEAPILGLFDSLNQVSIDGIPVAASGGRAVFFDRDVTNITGELPPADVAAANAIVGVILRYETKGPPERATVQWSSFNEVIPAVRGSVFAEDETRSQTLGRTRPTLEWLRKGAPKEPPLAKVPEPKKGGWLGGASKLTDEEQASIVEALLRNTYRAFDYRNESAIYDALARSVAGEMLAGIYLNIRRGLEIEAEGGPTTKVLAVDVLRGKTLSADKDGRRFRYDGEWAVTGSVEHWGHVHTRKNAYRAEFTIAVLDDAWKIETLHVNRQERLETKLVRRGVPEETPTP